MMTDTQVAAFLTAAQSPDAADLVRAALIIPLVEHRVVDPAPTMAELDRLGQRARTLMEGLGGEATATDRIAALNSLLFDEEGFTGNETRYDDPRNSFLNEVMTRRTGIPITLAVVYLDVAWRAGFDLEGVNFPGHFLVRAPQAPIDLAIGEDLLIDPFHRGALLTRADCERLLERHVGGDTPFSRDLLASAHKHEILVRMLTNLKRLYVRFRSFPQAREVTNLLLALDPAQAMERRDRGLLSYQLHDYRPALRDLEGYLQQLAPVPKAVDDEVRQEYEQIWEHVKTLRRRLASFN
jgi:regulator of sirC expression with transglutaminase-like and TPR domain